MQAEFSLTQVLGTPVAGRIFFEQAIRDNLDIGRPDQVGLIFGRRRPSFLRSVRDFARKEWPLRGSPAEVSGPADMRGGRSVRSAGGR